MVEATREEESITAFAGTLFFKIKAQWPKKEKKKTWDTEQS